MYFYLFIDTSVNDGGANVCCIGVGMADCDVVNHKGEGGVSSALIAK